MTRGQPHDLATLSEQQGIRGYNQRVGFQLDDVGESCFDFCLGGGIQGIKLHAKRVGATLHLMRLGL